MPAKVSAIVYIESLILHSGRIMLKRSFDVFFAVFFLILFAPVMVMVSMAVYSRMGFPIFFAQDRPGRSGENFALIKFRTMIDTTHINGLELSDEERLIPFGRFLRATSLDELPEFINVLKGDMSLVGPRPLLMEYMSLYNARQARRHEVRPGITGWAQVNGRNALSWEEKFELDVWYVDNQSLWLDIKILFKTVLQVLKRDGISHGEDATMPRFKGSNRDD